MLELSSELKQKLKAKLEKPMIFKWYDCVIN